MYISYWIKDSRVFAIYQAFYIRIGVFCTRVNMYNIYKLILPITYLESMINADQSTKETILAPAKRLIIARRPKVELANLKKIDSHIIEATYSMDRNNKKLTVVCDIEDMNQAYDNINLIDTAINMSFDELIYCTSHNIGGITLLIKSSNSDIKPFITFELIQTNEYRYGERIIIDNKRINHDELVVMFFTYNEVEHDLKYKIGENMIINYNNRLIYGCVNNSYATGIQFDSNGNLHLKNSEKTFDEYVQKYSLLRQ